MARGLEWFLSFNDRISGPARKMLGSVDELEGKLRRLGVSLDELGEGADLSGFLEQVDKLDRYLESVRGEARRANVELGRMKGARLANSKVVDLADMSSGRTRLLGDDLRAYAEAGNGLNHTARGHGGKRAGTGERGVQTNFARLVQAVGEVSPRGAEQLLNAGRGLVELDSKLQAVGLSLEGVVAGFAAAGAAAAAFVAVGATALVLGGSELVLGAAAFKEDSIAAFKLLLKNDSLAQGAYQQALRTADLLGANRRDTVTSFQQLMAKGFDLTTITNITKAMADLKAINPTANIQSLNLAIGQIKGKGRLQGEELMQLAEAGLSQASVMEALAEATGKSVGDVDKALRAGKIDAKQGIDAILASVQKLTGKPLGEAAIEKANSLSGLLEQLSWENVKDRLLLDVDLGPGFEVVRGALKNLNVILNDSTAAGKRLRDSIGKAFGGLFTSVFGDFSGPDGAQLIEKTILRIVGVIESVLAGVTGFFSGFGGALADGLGLGAKAFEEMNAEERAKALEKITEQAKMLGEALGYMIVVGAAVVGMFVGLGEAVSFVAQAIFDPINMILGWLDGLVPGFHAKGSSLGLAIANGMTFGIYGAISQLFGAGAAMGQAAEDGVRTQTKTHSPSELFGEIAGDLIDGFTGRMANDNGPEMAAAAMIGSPADLAQDARRAGARMGGAPSGGGSRTYNIVITAPSGEARAIRREVADLLDELEASAA